MFKSILVIAVASLALAAAKPSIGHDVPLAYSYSGPVAYTSPVAYSAYSNVPAAYSTYPAYSSPVVYSAATYPKLYSSVASPIAYTTYPKTYSIYSVPTYAVAGYSGYNWKK